MNRGPEKLGRFLGALVTIGLCLLITSCSTYRLSTLNHDPIYGPEVVLEVPSDIKIDTINSFSKLRYKLRTNFSFRWDFAQYAMNQPYSFYWNNPMLEGIWRPYNRFDVYFHSYHFWTDWAFGYPYNNWNSFYSWNRPWSYYGWNRPYDPWNNWYEGPWHNSSYNVVWNSSRRGERGIAYINGPRGSRGNSIIPRDDNNNNIENRIIVNRNKPRNYNNNLDDIVKIIRNGNDEIPVRIYNNPNNLNNDKINGLNIRSNRSTEGNNNGWRSSGGKIVPPNSTRPVFPSSSQSGQVRRGSGTSSVQQSGGRSSSSGQGGRGSSGIRN
jgi:hypothetical protein